MRKSDCWVAREHVILGYNYYEDGMTLSKPHLEVPEDYETKPIINYIKRTEGLIKQNTQEMNTLNLSAVDALKVVDWYPLWG